MDKFADVGVVGLGAMGRVSPCSGNGFKFAPLIGEIAADLALKGGTDYAIGVFSPNRFARELGGAAKPHVGRVR
jgi:glycine/D-amino acid oxidase-like deaminating enzyme